MPWDRSAPSNPKYKTREHRAERAKWAQLMHVQRYLVCAQPVCVMTNRVIHHGEAWHLGHGDDGVTYLGPTHPRCNVKDGARRGRAKQNARPDRWYF